MCKLNLHAILPLSHCNGPGKRAVIWVQGCKLRCPGCFNPGTHDFSPRLLLSPADVFEQIRRQDIEGITLSGGEPFCQAVLLADLCRMARAGGLSVLAYSGYTLKQLQGMEEAAALMDVLDILIDGPYRKEVPPAHPWAGSGNQHVHFLTPRYRRPEIISCRRQEREIVITPAGDILMTGF